MLTVVINRDPRDSGSRTVITDTKYATKLLCRMADRVFPSSIEKKLCTLENQDGRTIFTTVMDAVRQIENDALERVEAAKILKKRAEMVRLREQCCTRGDTSVTASDEVRDAVSRLFHRAGHRPLPVEELVSLCSKGCQGAFSEFISSIMFLCQSEADRHWTLHYGQDGSYTLAWIKEASTLSPDDDEEPNLHVPKLIVAIRITPESIPARKTQTISFLAIPNDAVLYGIESVRVGSWVSAPRVHPHVNEENGQLCVGDATDALLMFVNSGMMVEAVDAIEAVLDTYEPDSAYHTIRDILEEEDDDHRLCGGCGRRTHIDELYRCPHCESDDYMCDSCTSTTCKDCEEMICDNCVDSGDVSFCFICQRYGGCESGDWGDVTIGENEKSVCRGCAHDKNWMCAECGTITNDLTIVEGNALCATCDPADEDVEEKEQAAA